MSSPSKLNRSVLILFSVVVLDLIGFGVVVPILPFYAEKYGASATVLGLLLMSFSAMQFLFSSLWGKLSDKIGRKKVLILTMSGSGLSLIVVGLAPSLLFIFVGRILSGIFAANISVASAYIADVTTEENRAKGMGLIGAAFGIGFILGPALGGFLAPYGYHVPILAAALLTFLNTFYAFIRLPEPPRHHPIKEKIKTSVLSQKPVMKLCLIYFVFTLSVNQLESIFAFYMMDRFSYDARHVAYILTFMALIMVAMQGGFIRALSQKYGESILFKAGAIFLAVALLTIPDASKVTILLIPLGLASIGRGLCQPSLLSLVSKKALDHMKGSTMGTFQSSASLGRVMGPLLAGTLYDHGHSLPFFLAAGLMMLTFLLTATI